jgi:hypothetical protein
MLGCCPVGGDPLDLGRLEEHLPASRQADRRGHLAELDPPGDGRNVDRWDKGLSDLARGEEVHGSHLVQTHKILSIPDESPLFHSTVHRLVHMSSVFDWNKGDIPEWTMGDRLGKARRAAGLTRDQLAAELGTHRNTLRSYETDRVGRLNLSLIRLWALRCGVPLLWLVGTDGDEEEIRSRSRCTAICAGQRAYSAA